MFFNWLRQRRRRKLLVQPFPKQWTSLLEDNVGLYRRLSPEKQTRLGELLRVFLAEKDWVGCAGLEITDEIKVTISALACLLLLGIEHDYFSRVQSILVFPDEFPGLDQAPLGDNVLLESPSTLLGEAHYRGPVRLSWKQVRRDARRSGTGHNVVLHEFAHQLDMLDGAIDGTPPLRTRQESRRWSKIMTSEFRQLIAEAEHGMPTLLDDYGAKNEAEFFAVATECFFDRAEELAQEHPRLYGLLRDYFGQDPRKR